MVRFFIFLAFCLCSLRVEGFISQSQTTTRGTVPKSNLSIRNTDGRFARILTDKTINNNAVGIADAILRIRGGAGGRAAAAAASATATSPGVGVLAKFFSTLWSSPESLFNTLLFGLAGVALSTKLADLMHKKSTVNGKSEDNKPEGVKKLQLQFLSVFWLMRMADWLQGPYFYEVYSSKIINGAQVSLDLVSKLFLVGFATTGIFGPWLGRMVDAVGRKAGTLAFAALYTLGALSTRSNKLPLLILGRLAGGLGTSLLFCAPEAWLAGEHARQGFDGNWLGQTFGWAYAGDSLVAITAGQLASMTASKVGPTGPFTLSVGFLALGSMLAGLFWQENVAQRAKNSNSSNNNNNNNNNDSNSNKESDTAPSIADAWKVMTADKRILLVGAVQALFEGAMYVFVLQWPPAFKESIFASSFGKGAAIPFGKIFSCFMASCLIGSSTFGAVMSRGISIEATTSVFLAVATAAMAIATAVGNTNLSLLIAAFFAFEACVGMYFPSISTLRSKYVPDSHKSVILNIFGIPVNLIVVSVFLSIKRLGVQGALACATGALGIATVCATALSRISASAAAAEKQKQMTTKA